MWSLILVVAGGVFAPSSREVAAQSQNPPGPDRFSFITVEYTKYYWWMIEWGDQDPVCEVEVDHEGIPTPGDVYVDCGEEIYDEWVEQGPCLEVNLKLCDGFFVVLVGSKPAQKNVATKLPAPTVRVTLENCNPVYTSSTSICEFEPILVLTGIEPLPEYTITGIEGLYETQPFSCGAVCRLKLPVTGENIFTLQFWAYSSYGDSSEIFNAQIRVALTDAGDPDRSYWYVDVLSRQWAGVPIASCVANWGAFPPIGGPPRWLSTPTQSETLGSEIPYHYLAANLIKSGAVDASMCADFGLLPDGTANNCGMEAARPAVNEWQNQFDDIILTVAKDTGVPAHLLKNLFAIESQFWPSVGAKDDVGLGQLTEHGADTAFLWNPPFFHQFCPLVMDSKECGKGYLRFDEAQQKYVRQALVQAVNAVCETCPLGIDLERAKFSISVFAHALMANCDQASQVVWNYNNRRTPAQLGISYEDMWKFTLINYNAGSGCLASAFEDASDKNAPLTFEGISPYLAPACRGAIEYVNQISNP